MQRLSTGARRTTAAGLLAVRVPAPENVTGVKRSELAGAARDAGEALKLRGSLRLVLGELVGCYGEQMVEAGLLVWPANSYLVRRTGLAERTIRMALRALIELGLIAARDSANRKRFAVRGVGGDVLEAYGFSLNPLYARRHDLAAEVLRRRLAAEALSRVRDRITIARKAIEAALELAPDQVRVEKLAKLVAALPRRSSPVNCDELLVAFEALQDEAEAAVLAADQESAGKRGTTCRHIESNKDRSTDTCSSSDEEVATLVARGCPAIEAYGEKARGVMGLELAGERLRSSIGAGPDAWREAVESIGRPAAAALVCLVLQLHEEDAAAGRNRIRNPGGLYRSMVRRVASGNLIIAAELTAMVRRRTN